jgi:hypothetical protein
MGKYFKLCKEYFKKYDYIITTIFISLSISLVLFGKYWEAIAWLFCLMYYSHNCILIGVLRNTQNESDKQSEEF